MAIPKGFFPIQDSGRLNGGLRADQSISSEEMGRKMKQLVGILMKDPAVRPSWASPAAAGAAAASWRWT